MTNRKKEIAKFLCGVEAFHALVHTYFGLSRTTYRIFGVKVTPPLHAGAAVVNAAVATGLGVYAWGPAEPRRPEDQGLGTRESRGE